MPPMVLLVDDEPNILLSLKFLIQKEGYEVLVPKTVTRPFRSPVRNCLTWSFLMSCCRAPMVMKCVRLRAEPELNATHILMLTAKSNPTEREKGLAMGADDYISKPFSNRELVDKVRLILGSDRAVSPEEYSRNGL